MRIVRMQGVDLNALQFDYDLTFAALFLHADGTVYARYGARESDRDAMSLSSLAGLEATMRRVLAAHAAYPQNQPAFAGKRGPEARFKHAEDMPAEVMRKRAAARGAKESCIHCHMVHQADQEIAIAEKRYDPKRFFRFPPPSSVGLTLDPEHGTKVSAVEGDTIAQRAGFEPGDVILRAGGQAILSTADFVWALHHASDTLRGELARGGERRQFTLTLHEGWRPPNLSWRASMYAMPPRLGLWVQELTDLKRAFLLLKKDRLALEVRGLLRPVVRRSGLRVGDVILAVNDEVERRTPGEFHAFVRLRCSAQGSKLKLDVARGKERLEIIVEL